MRDEIFIAGAGGQGILSLGKTLAEAVAEKNLQVTFYPSYGAEIRGGTTNCTVIISDEAIGSPTVSNVRSMLVMNTQSYNKFIPRLNPGGLLVINSSLVDVSAKPVKAKTASYAIPATDIAQELGDIRCANMVMLGAYEGIKKLISVEYMAKAIESTFKKPELVKLNIEAFKKGIEGVKPL
ncbi:MAG: hypothetical protein A2252_07545 [Elusimicrobia bacterium RIFOXYA2_FULL_39_19]|nr:MAG: hypothetical protein A2252_07545 [Elusimicrobia bacterium RIFOXYA2_FULL_39_19]